MKESPPQATSPAAPPPAASAQATPPAASTPGTPPASASTPAAAPASAPAASAPATPTAAEPASTASPATAPPAPQGKAEVAQPQATPKDSSLWPPSLSTVLWVLGGLVLVAAIVAGVWWWRKRKAKGSAATAPKPMASGRLLEIRDRFLWAQSWRKRTAIADLPTVVVLGPAGSGKTKMVELDVDWQRQASQFMPSVTDDPLLQMYLGPESVVHEVSAPLLEDASKQAHKALTRLWKDSVHRGQALVVVVLDVRWLSDTPPDEVRRMAYLIRGRINLLSEVCKAPVEVRLCMTHMDTFVGFTDFARMLRTHAEPLHFEVPPPGEEARLEKRLHELEKYLAAGLATLALGEFERLEAFFSGMGKPFGSLGRFVAALREGGRLSQPLKLSRVYLSSPSREARALGTFAIEAEVAPSTLQADYRRMHLRRCALLMAVCTVPVLAAYANFRSLLTNAQDQMGRFDKTVKRLQEQGLAVEGPVLAQRGQDAMEAMEKLFHATRYWPPLRSSFTDDLEELRKQMADIIRDYYLRPLLKQCQQQCEVCASRVPGCGPASTAAVFMSTGDEAEKSIC